MIIAAVYNYLKEKCPKHNILHFPTHILIFNPKGHCTIIFPYYDATILIRNNTIESETIHDLTNPNSLQNITKHL